jgi:hypothetical protein
MSATVNGLGGAGVLVGAGVSVGGMDEGVNVGPLVGLSVAEGRMVVTTSGDELADVDEHALKRRPMMANAPSAGREISSKGVLRRSFVMSD